MVPALTGEVRVVESVPDAFAGEAIRILSAAARRGGATFFASGGPTAAACYARLAETAPAGGPVAWTEVDVYLGDEHCVDDGADANHAMVRDALVDRVGPLRSFRPMSCAEGPGPYAELVRALPAIDLVHLGMGPDGHTASLFPGSAALGADDGTLVVRSEDPSGRMPHPRMTLTLPAIARAGHVVFTVSGAAKHDAFAALQQGEDLPAGRVRAGSVLWLVDEEAANGA